MALHGDIMVNDRLIGTWEAIRKEELPGGGRFRYATVLDLYGHTVGSVEHTYSDGAAVLASKVLMTGSHT